jgi:hypothetical protein
MPTRLCLMKPEALDHSNEIRQRLRIHLLHGVASVDLDRDLANQRRNRSSWDPRESS